MHHVTVHLLIPSTDLNTDEPLDSFESVWEYVSELLAQRLEADGTILDWGFAKDAEGRYCHPRPFVQDLATYEDGDFLADAEGRLHGHYKVGGE